MSAKSVLLAITIDTEQDCDPHWGVSMPLSFRSVVEGVPGVLQPLFAEYGASATYLVSPSVLKNDESVAVLAGLGDSAELGAHLHGEFIVPGPTRSNGSTAPTDDMECFYEEDVERGKLATLTELFRDRLGYAPSSFRAGRFAASARTLRLLDSLGYTVDSSVTPGVVWTDPQGTLDFSRAPEQPYRPSVDDICRPGGLSILEVPVTTAPSWACRSHSARHLTRAVSPLSPRLARSLAARVWLRPSFASGRAMLGAIDYHVQTYSGAGLVALTMMFHSIEIIPGASPYALRDRDVRRLIDRVAVVLRYCCAAGVESVTLSEMRDRFVASGV